MPHFCSYCMRCFTNRLIRFRNKDWMHCAIYFIASLCIWLLCTNTQKIYAEDPYAFNFTAPKVCKLDWNTRSLIADDLNGDGKQDLLVLNNELGRINIFYQKTKDLQIPPMVSMKKNKWDPILDDHPFVPSFVVTGVSMLSLAVGDIDGDGLKDLVFSTKDAPLVIRFQSEKGDFQESLILNRNIRSVSRSDAINILDFDNDGRNEIMLSTQNSLLMVRVEIDRQYGEIKEFPWSSNPVYWQAFIDINDDGLKDVLYYTDGSLMRPFRVRYQIKDAQLGHEKGISINQQNTMHPMGKKGYFAGINRRSGSIEVKKLITKDADNRLEALMSHAIFPLRGKVDSVESYAVGDLDSDGLEDVIVANPEKASVDLFLAVDTKSAFTIEDSYPTLKGVDFMAMGCFQDKDIQQVLMLSTHENLMGISDYNTDQGLLFPALLDFENDLICATAADTDQNGLSEVIWISKNRSNYFLHNSEWDEKKKEWNTNNVDLGKMSRKPRSIIAFDIDKNGSRDLLLLASREPMRIFQNANNRQFREVLENSATRKSLLEGVLVENLGMGDIDQDGKDELLVSSEGFIRAFSVSSDASELTVHGQFNAREGTSLLCIPFLTFSDKGTPILIAYDKKERNFQFLRKTNNGFEFYTQRSVDTINPLGIHSLWNENRDTFLILSDDKMLFLNSKQPILEMKNAGYYETFLKGIRHTELVVGNFNADEKMDFIAYDGLNHALEVLESRDESYSQWESKMHFNIFETNLHYKGPQGAQFEPRESISADLNSDNEEDFAFLVHDRILIYFQK